MNIFLRCLLRWKESFNHFVADKRISFFVSRPSSVVFRNKKGQVAVILILVVAAALIFYAISLNLGRISQTKVATTIAADTGASLMASYMASLGQSVFKTSLGGNTKVCGWTGIAASIMAIVVMIIAVVIVVATQGAGSAAAAAMFQAAAVGIALALAAIAIQATVIQPGLSSQYNSILWHALDSKDVFTEQGVQTALGGAATDSVQVADLLDFDGDRVWGVDVNGQPLDKISRFGFYYRQMRINTIPLPPANDIQYFLDSLRNFLTDDGDDWGIFDETGPVCEPFSANSECNPCCILPNYWKEEMGCAADINSDPNIYTPNPADVASMRTTCANNSPYGAAYPWVYDPYRENPLNNVNPLDPNFFISFREQLGRDDEHRDFRKPPADPNNIQNSIPGDGFKLEDTTGFHAADNRTGVFKFFYKIADWGVNLQSLVTNAPLNPQCNWCNNPSPGPSCPWCNVGTPGTTCDATATYPPEFPQLALPVDPMTLTYNTTYCVDGTNLVPGNPPLAVDLVRLPDLTDAIWTLGYNGGVNDAIIPDIGKIEANVDQCAQNYRDDPSVGFWKRGGDRFCSPGGDAWPYYGECSKYNYGSCFEADGVTPDPAGCKCGEDATVPANFPDDLMDDLVYGLNDFIKWANDFLAKDATTLSKEFKNWYPDASVWIEPGSATPPTGNSATNNPGCTSSSCCYMCPNADGTPTKDGALWVWYKDIQEIRKRLEAWRKTSFAGTDCRDVWCVPPDLTGETPPYNSCSATFPTPPPPSEEATFDTNGNGIRGDIEDIRACVNWNANDQIVFGGTTATGNADKFRECNNACTNALTSGNYDAANFFCANLPRSLVPGFDTSSYRPTDIAELVTCRDVVCPAAPLPPPPTFCTAYGVSYNCVTDFAAIQAQIDVRIAAGSCADTNPSCACSDTGCSSCGFKDLVDKSIPEADNQVAKFKQRYAFLKGRLDEMDNFIAVLGAAENQFYQFLTCEDNNGDGQPDGAACKLIKARIDADSRETGLPYYAIYGWQSEPEKGQPVGSGKWHLVRADARIPEKCDNDCNPDQTPGSTTIDGDPRWPWVRTYTKSWGMKRCYELSGTSGLVKVRVSRFDESGTFPTLLFPNAVEIWKPTFSRGDRPSTADPGTLGAVCNPSMIADPGQPSAFPGSYYYGAFILNKRVDNAAYVACIAACAGDTACEATCTPGNAACWDLANELLSGGVTSEACAQYYFHGGNPNGMDFKFVPCPAF